MKKVFYGSTFLLLQIMMFTYLLIEKDFSGEVLALSLLNAVSDTGISVIGFIFVMPAIVFTILTLCMDKKVITFCRDMFSLFASFFCLATGIIGIFVFNPYYYIPIVLIVASSIIFILALINTINMLKSENKTADK